MQMKCHFICYGLISWIILSHLFAFAVFIFGAGVNCVREEWSCVCVARWRDDSVRDLTPGSLALSPVPLWSWQQVSIGSFSGEGVPLEQVANLYLGLTSPQKAVFSAFFLNFVVFYSLATMFFVMKIINKTYVQKGGGETMGTAAFNVFFFFLYSSQAPQLEQ